MARPRNLIPTVGMGLTVHIGSDRYASTISRVGEKQKIFWFTYDNAANGDGERSLYQAYRDVQGQWRVSVYKQPITLGERAPHLDPSF